MDEMAMHFVNGCKTLKEDGAEKNDIETLNWYRNLYYKEEQDTERGIMARAINGLFMQMKDNGIDLDKLDGKHKFPLDI